MIDMFFSLAYYNSDDPILQIIEGPGSWLERLFFLFAYWKMNLSFIRPLLWLKIL